MMTLWNSSSNISRLFCSWSACTPFPAAVLFSSLSAPPANPTPVTPLTPTKAELIVSRRLPAWARRRTLTRSTDLLADLDNTYRSAKTLRPSKHGFPFPTGAGRGGDEERASQSTLPGVIQRLRELSLSDARCPDVWSSVCEGVLTVRHKLLPCHLAEALRFCAKVGFRHEGLGREACKALGEREGDVRSVVVALICLMKLKLPYFTLQLPFLNQLSELVETLSFTDLKLSLVALSQLRVDDPPLALRLANRMFHESLRSDVALCPGEFRRMRKGHGGGAEMERMRTLMEVQAAAWVDSRDFLAVPFCLGRIGVEHSELMEYSGVRVRSLYVSRIRCRPIEALQALQGFTEAGTRWWKFAKICDRYCRFVLRECTTRELLLLAGQIKSLDLNSVAVWSVWSESLTEHRDALSIPQLGQLSSFLKAVGRPTQQVLETIAVKAATEYKETWSYVESPEGEAVSHDGATHNGLRGERVHDAGACESQRFVHWTEEFCSKDAVDSAAKAHDKGIKEDGRRGEGNSEGEFRWVSENEVAERRQGVRSVSIQEPLCGEIGRTQIERLIERVAATDRALQLATEAYTHVRG
eukprot:GHVQ01001980.1.p1 GENE.GHVQ01001980.1~~GHVQ01001980.1.p1  ORF type:complete len:584 (-),score=70.84 GHVQ01001980.1:2038-3789(-)